MADARCTRVGRRLVGAPRDDGGEHCAADRRVAGEVVMVPTVTQAMSTILSAIDFPAERNEIVDDIARLPVGALRL